MSDTNEDSLFERLQSGKARLLSGSRAMLHRGLTRFSRGAEAVVGRVRPLQMMWQRAGWIRAQLYHARILVTHPDQRSRFVRTLRLAVANLKDPKAGMGAERARGLIEDIRGFRNRPLISILVPVYNTPAGRLRACIESVRGQIYPYWELCLADDGSSSTETLEVLESYASMDARIRLLAAPSQAHRGISHATNAALSCAQGEFVALLDHDDELTADALYWVAERLNARPDTDYLYSDEDKLDPSGILCDRFFKPDWSPELMLNCMYTGHLSVYRTSRVRSLGGFRPEFDFAQDYDLALRVTEQTDRIEHVPRILYHWYRAPGSAATGGDSKSFAREANRRALEDALLRRGIDAVVETPKAVNRVRIRSRQPVRVSLIIPTDSERNLGDCLEAIFARTAYPDLEIVVVTNSGLAETMRRRYPDRPQLVFCRFDKPFNFSQKCNEGAKLASGEIVVFFNDDVRPLGGDWVEDLIELLVLPEVGAVSPKLLYEDRTLQHAGLVTGVRGLVGTAFHKLPADAPDYFAFALSVRDASAISGACLAMRRRDFADLDGFDAENTPINHSDVDLCFRVRERGLRCVYTPHATLLHIGHLSLADFEKAEKKKQKKPRDKSDVFLLKRWAGFSGEDPYYTEPMRDLLYRDSPAPFRLYGENSRKPYAEGRDALFISHELSESGAPLVLYYAVEHYVKSGGFAVVLAPQDGPFRARYQALGVPVVIDSVAFTQPHALAKLVAGFDLIVANTIVSWPLVYVAQEAGIPTLWYIHESGYIETVLSANKDCWQALRRARNVLVGSERAYTAVRRYNASARILHYGVPDLYEARPPDATGSRDKLVFSMLGSIERRKGQDVLARAIKLLPDSYRERAVFHIVGRTLEPEALRQLTAEIKDLPCVQLRDGVDLAEYRRLLHGSDVIVCVSRDDTLPLVTLDALACGKVLLCTDSTGTSAFLQDGVNGLVVKNEDVELLSSRLRALIDDAGSDPGALTRIGEQARKTFLEQFSMAVFNERFAAAVEEALAQAPASEEQRSPGPKSQPASDRAQAQ